MNRGVVSLCAAGALLGAPAAASADQVIEAQAMWRFDALDYTIDQGEPLLFRNSDALSPGPHDVTSNDAGPDGKPVFASETIPAGQEAPVTGATQLKTGSYGFYCSVHPFMTATLNVTDQGTPAGGGAPQPPPGADTQAPRLQVSLRPASLRTKVFAATATSDEQADVTARLSARVGRRTFTIGTASALRAAAGDQVRLRIAASKAARRKLRKARRATLTLAVEGRDAAGNVGTAVARRQVKR